MFSLIDILNVSAAWIGAITGVVSLIYSLKVNRVKLSISKFHKKRMNEDSCYQYSFVLSNQSNSNVVIKNIQLFDKNGKEIFDNGFNPANALPEKKSDPFGLISSTQTLFNVDWYSEPFEDEIELNPYSFHKLSYYLNEPPHTIKVKTNKQIHFLSKSKSFHPVFNKAK
jgi:hypothetical protein